MALATVHIPGDELEISKLVWSDHYLFAASRSREGERVRACHESLSDWKGLGHNQDGR